MFSARYVDQDRFIAQNVPSNSFSCRQSFKKRAKEIADQAHNPRGAVGEGADFLRGLDEEERQCKYLPFFRNDETMQALKPSNSIPSCSR